MYTNLDKIYKVGKEKHAKECNNLNHYVKYFLWDRKIQIEIKKKGQNIKTLI